MVETRYAKGVRLTPREMKAVESEIVRWPSLEKWFVEIPPKLCDIRDG